MNSSGLDPEPWTPKLDSSMAFYVVFGGISMLIAWIFLCLRDWLFSSLFCVLGFLSIGGITQVIKTKKNQPIRVFKLGFDDPRLIPNGPSYIVFDKKVYYAKS